MTDVMAVEKLISNLRAAKVKLWVDGAKLRFSAPPGVMTDQMRAELSMSKAVLIDWLQQTTPVAQRDASPVPLVERGHDLVLSFGQERLWFLYEMEPESPAYNVSTATRVVGPLDYASLRQSFCEILARHEVLKTTISTFDGRPQPVISLSPTTELPLTDLRGLGDCKQDEVVRRLISNETRRPFDLFRGPVLRTGLLRAKDDEHVLLITLHHAFCDGWSMQVLYRELAAFYEAGRSGRPSRLPPLDVQYADYAAWQRKRLDERELQSQLAYWREQLKNASPSLELPTDRPRPAVQSFPGARQPFSLSKSLSLSLNELSRNEGATLFMTLLTSFQALLCRYTDQNDIVVGSPIAGRMRPEFEELIGLFMNTLAFRAEMHGNPRFSELLTQVRGRAFEAYAHQDVPFEKIVEELQPERDLSRAPLFQVMFVLQNVPTGDLSFSELRLRPLEAATHTAKFDLTLEMVETESGLAGALEYNTDLFDGATIERVLGHFRILLEGIVANPNQRLSDLPLITEAERSQALIEWNATQSDYPKDACLHELVRDRVDKDPDAVALVFRDEQVTYRELNARADQLACRLRTMGVGPEVRVGVCLNRSVELVVSLLGILKAGGAYVPLDPEYPPQRLELIVESSKPGVLLTQNSLVERLGNVNAPIFRIDTDWATIHDQRQSVDAKFVGPENLAYVTFTSGSTGNPKGVPICHRSVVNFITAMQSEPGLAREDVVVSVTTISFDISVLELFCPLITGARLIVVEHEAVRDGRQLVDVVERSGATTMQGTPATWRLMLDAGWSGSRNLKVLVGGQALTQELATQLVRRQTSVWNMYGPTESTVWSTVDRVNSAPGSITIGRPIANTQVYVLDRTLKPLPPGIPGELYIGGHGLSRGYWERPELAAQSFVPNPFGRAERLYRTGDKVCYLSDGRIEFLGRVDHQVKIRGYRIELAEVETAIEQHPMVGQAVALVREDGPGGERLCAYVVADGEVKAPVLELREFLANRLPEYMLPSNFVMLDTLPLTPNGKIDRRALPKPDQESIEPGELHVAPRDPYEQIVADIWCDVLGIKRVGVHDNFFQLGGHSLLATQVVSRVSAALGVDLPLRKLFEAPTVAGLAAPLERALGKEDRFQSQPVGRANRDGDLPLSFAQERLWFLNQLEPNSVAYTIPAAVGLVGRLDLGALEQAFGEIERRHEALRTTFSVVGERPIQVIGKWEPFSLPVVDLSALAERDRVSQSRCLAEEEVARPFDLSQGPLMRVALLRMADQEYGVFLTLHHVASDGWSTGVLVRELSTFYERFFQGRPSALPELAIQYVDFAVWQRQWLDGDLLDAQLSYWIDRLAGAPTSLNLPTDRSRPAVQTFRGASKEVVLSKNMSDGLKTLSQRQGATIFMTLLAAFHALLYRYTGQTKILVGTPIAGRNRPEVEGLIGFFVNTLVMRADLHGGMSFQELLEQVREAALGAYAHQDLPFEKLVDELGVHRDQSRTPLFQVMFILQNAPMEALKLSELTFKPLESEQETAKFDLTLSFLETAQGLRGSLEYNTDLFEAGTIQRMLGHFERLLDGIIASPGQRLSELPLLREQEHAQLLTEWNATQAAHPQKVVHELFEAQARKTPDQAAVIFEQRQLTYRELNCRANQLARHLRTLGVGPGLLVGLNLERSLEMVIGLLGVLKAGAAYVPLDSSYPSDRLAFMLKDSNVRVLLSQEQLIRGFPDHEAQEVCLDTEWEMIAQQSAENLCCGAQGDDLAYVIYTSGSTGRPKGVEMCHSSLSNLISWQLQRSKPFSGSRTAQFASVNFDVSFQEIFSTWCSGGTLVLVAEDSKRDPIALLASLANNRIERVFLPFVALRHLAETSDGHEAGLAPLREVITAGEQLQVAAQISHFFDQLPFCTLDNQYGPTESHVVTAFKLTGSTNVWPALPYIGRPVDNTQIYLLDSSLQTLPIGVAGELHIGGVQVARCYLNRPELTADKFIPDPFSSEPAKRLYKTGDLARYRQDGTIEFLGRIDHQVKIRGFRVELGEIEATLMRHADVREAVVLPQEDQIGGSRLVAYLTTHEERALATSDLRDFLRADLPDYMVPSSFVTLESFPLTPSGKIDRLKLSALDPTPSDLEETYVAPHTPHEEILVDIWSQLLGVDRVGIHDSFFDLGGHSLLAAQLLSRVREAFSLELSLRSLFDDPTVAGLAANIMKAIQSGQTRNAPPLEPGQRNGPLPLSYAQQRLWLLDRMKPGNPIYNLPAALRLSGRLNVPALDQTFHEILCRHHVLRVIFADKEGSPVQIIGPVRCLLLPVVDLSSLPLEERGEQLRGLVDADAQRPFDLGQGPLLRVRLVRLGEDEHAVQLVMHHIICDGWSIAVLVSELSEIYAAHSQGRYSRLVDLPIQYTDYAQWQRQWLQGEVLENQLSYWRRHLGGELPILQLSGDRTKPKVAAHRAATKMLVLPAELTQGIRQLCRREKVTLFMTLLAALQALLYRHTRDEDIVVATDMAGRNDVKVEGLIGFFINLLLMRTDLSGNPNFRELLHRVRETALGAYAHQDVPFEKLVEELQPQRHLSNTPLFQVLFVLQNVPRETLSLPGLTLTPIEIQGGAAKFNLVVFVSEANDQLATTWVYDSDIIDADQIDEMTRHYEKILRKVVTEPDTRLRKVTFQAQYDDLDDGRARETRRESKIAKLKRRIGHGQTHLS